jgi:hypothetical protein
LSPNRIEGRTRWIMFSRLFAEAVVLTREQYLAIVLITVARGPSAAMGRGVAFMILGGGWPPTALKGIASRLRDPRPTLPWACRHPSALTWAF